MCPGGHLSFNCSTNLNFIEWNVTISQSGRPDTRRQLAIVTPATKLESYLIINGHTFNITRSSPPDILPLTSTLAVSNTVAATKIKTSVQRLEAHLLKQVHLWQQSVLSIVGCDTIAIDHALTSC